ncbi:hypothetical protein LOTGIDRAFT_174519 [Lottia gigantea]|uniref:C-type lectin domain-containing protein n=1 Tax=Lottia gigantea TaxID=225164 RepID=V4AQY1_LOTGI|nr:hypothetical protein LOTGIDRAFT_174519 [Lottia gigantea]ESO97235.1 hypothetical protein LOTGIDRAFT_174519 [Lottia gigantea]
MAGLAEDVIGLAVGEVVGLVVEHILRLVIQYLAKMMKTCQISLSRIYYYIHVVWLLIALKTGFISLGDYKQPYPVSSISARNCALYSVYEQLWITDGPTDGPTERDNVSLAPTERLNITIFTQESTWNEAYYACQYHGMELLTMKSKDVADALSLLFANNSTISLSETDYWIGLYVLDVTTEFFQWTDGDGLGNWTLWFSPEPNSIQSDRCVRVHEDPTNSFEWKTMLCDRPYAFICQQYIGECTMELTSLLPVEEKQKTVRVVDSEKDCNNLCLSVILNSTEQCFIAYKDKQFCNMYLSENPGDFIQVDKVLPKDVNYYRKICFQGFKSQRMVNYTNTHTMPFMNSSVSDSYLNSSEIDTLNHKTTVTTTSPISSEMTSASTTSDDAVMYDELTTLILSHQFESLEQRDTASLKSSTTMLSTNKLSALSTSILTSQYMPSEYLNLYSTPPWTITEIIMTIHSTPTESSTLIGASEISISVSSIESSALSDLISSSDASLSDAETETTYELEPSLTSRELPEHTTFPSVFSSISGWFSVEIHSSSKVWSIYTEEMLRSTTDILTLESIPTINYSTYKRRMSDFLQDKIWDKCSSSTFNIILERAWFSLKKSSL